MLYWIHRVGHKIPFILKFHGVHHGHINTNITGWSWNNLLLFNDNWPSTIDLWITEVIPTLIFSYLTGQWWLSIFYYVWAALLQEELEHRRNFNMPILTCGEWHLKHHRRPDKNFGLFFPVWDKLFKTEA